MAQRMRRHQPTGGWKCANAESSSTSPLLPPPACTAWAPAVLPSLGGPPAMPGGLGSSAAAWHSGSGGETMAPPVRPAPPPAAPSRPGVKLLRIAASSQDGSCWPAAGCGARGGAAPAPAGRMAACRSLGEPAAACFSFAACSGSTMSCGCSNSGFKFVSTKRVFHAHDSSVCDSGSCSGGPLAARVIDDQTPLGAPDTHTATAQPVKARSQQVRQLPVHMHPSADFGGPHEAGSKGGCIYRVRK